MLPSLIYLLQAAPPEDEHFSLFLLVFLILGIIFICICVFLAVLAVLFLLLLVFGCIAVGALSASVLVGISKKSLTAGFRTFVILFSTVGFAFLGAGSFWVLNTFKLWWSETQAILIGLGAGLVGGFLAGIAVAFAIKKLSAFLKNKLEERRNIGEQRV